MHDTATYLGHAGNRAAALALQRRVLAAREAALGAEHPGTLIARSSLARWTGEAGNAAARDEYAALLPVWERVLGADHPDTLVTRRNLAYWTRLAEGS